MSSCGPQAMRVFKMKLRIGIGDIGIFVKWMKIQLLEISLEFFLYLKTDLEPLVLVAFFSSGVFLHITIKLQFLRKEDTCEPFLDRLSFSVLFNNLVLTFRKREITEARDIFNPLFNNTTVLYKLFVEVSCAEMSWPLSLTPIELRYRVSASSSSARKFASTLFRSTISTWGSVDVDWLSESGLFVINSLLTCLRLCCQRIFRLSPSPEI